MTELLVVVTVTSVMGTMLLGGVSVVKGVAKSAQCQANLRQLGIAGVAYAADWEGNVVLGRNILNTTGFIYHDDSLGDYLAGLPDQFWRFAKLPAKLACPLWAMTQTYQLNVINYPNYSRIGYSETAFTVDPATIPKGPDGLFVGPGSLNYDYLWGTHVCDTPLAGVTKTSQRPWFMDLGYTRLDWFPDRLQGWYPTYAVPTFERHRQKGNVVFFDLHIAPQTAAECASGQILP